MISQREHDEIAATSEARFRAAFERRTAGLQHVSVGIGFGCAACGTLPHGWRASVDPGDWVDDGSFSWSPCDTCGSTLGGMRYAGHAVNVHGDTVHLDVCPDCAMAIANGEYPAFWQAHAHDGLQD